MDQKYYEKWLNYTLYLLSLKMRSRAEIIKKLGEKQVDENTQRLVLNFLTENRFLDDVQFALTYIEAKQKSYGPYRLKAYLKQKGVSPEDIEGAFDRLEDGPSSYEVAKVVLDKKMATTTIDWDRIKTDYAYKNKMYQKFSMFLAGRGFSGDVIKKVVRERLTDEFIDEF